MEKKYRGTGKYLAHELRHRPDLLLELGTPSLAAKRALVKDFVKFCKRNITNMQWSEPPAVAEAVVDYTSARMSLPEDDRRRWALSTAGSSSSNLVTGLWLGRISDVKKDPAIKYMKKTLRKWTPRNLPVSVPRPVRERLTAAAKPAPTARRRGARAGNQTVFPREQPKTLRNRHVAGQRHVAKTGHVAKTESGSRRPANIRKALAGSRLPLDNDEADEIEVGMDEPVRLTEPLYKDTDLKLVERRVLHALYWCGHSEQGATPVACRAGDLSLVRRKHLAFTPTRRPDQVMVFVASPKNDVPFSFVVPLDLELYGPLLKLGNLSDELAFDVPENRVNTITKRKLGVRGHTVKAAPVQAAGGRGFNASSVAMHASEGAKRHYAVTPQNVAAYDMEAGPDASDTVSSTSTFSLTPPDTDSEAPLRPAPTGNRHRVVPPGKNARRAKSAPPQPRLPSSPDTPPAKAVRVAGPQIKNKRPRPRARPPPPQPPQLPQDEAGPQA